MKVAVIGGGAAGFFAALAVKDNHPGAEVIVFERGSKVLSKVKVSGGGRCNVCHACFENRELLRHYPRGRQLLKKAFLQFSVHDTIAWFTKRGVELKTEKDGRMFPASDDSQTIVDLFTSLAVQKHIEIRLNSTLESLEWSGEGHWKLRVNGQWLKADRVIVCTGGSPKRKSLDWLAGLGHEIVYPVPSLFTFNLKEKAICELSGLSAKSVTVTVRGRKETSTGPLLITHWGFSGPAVLRLSAFEAVYLAEQAYEFSLKVNWLGQTDEESFRKSESWLATLNATRKLQNLNPTPLPQRMWEFLLVRAKLDPNARWADLKARDRNRLVNCLTNDDHLVSGKTTFKEEFVSAGGVSADSVDPETMKSRVCEGLYFAGEVLDIDGVTGGFNFQAAWTTAFVAARLK